MFHEEFDDIEIIIDIHLLFIMLDNMNLSWQLKILQDRVNGCDFRNGAIIYELIGDHTNPSWIQWYI